MSETREPTVEEELAILRNEAEAVDSGEPLPQEAAETKTPSGSEEAEGESEEGLSLEDNSEDESAGETDDEGSEPEEDGKAPEEGELEEAEVEEQSDPDSKVSQRTEKKKGALKRSWENADRRHRDADEREQLLRERESEILQREQQVAALEAEVPDDPLPKYSVDEISESLQEFIDEGEFDTAKDLVKSLAGKAKALAGSQGGGQGPGSPQFVDAWEQVRGQAIKANPELEDPKSDLYQQSTELLNGEWGPLFQSHPAGVAAAVEVAKLRMLAASSSELSEKFKQLEIENKKLKKAVALDGTTPTSQGARPEKWDSMNLDEQLDALRQEAVALSG